jgi:hypothetical protein
MRILLKTSDEPLQNPRIPHWPVFPADHCGCHKFDYILSFCYVPSHLLALSNLLDPRHPMGQNENRFRESSNRDPLRSKSFQMADHIFQVLRDRKFIEAFERRCHLEVELGIPLIAHGSVIIHHAGVENHCGL